MNGMSDRRIKLTPASEIETPAFNPEVLARNYSHAVLTLQDLGYVPVLVEETERGREFVWSHRNELFDDSAVQNHLTNISIWLDEYNGDLDPQARTWGRLAKLAEETGEVVSSYIGVTGQNPRKGIYKTMEDVGHELLDVAITALGAYEHIMDNEGVAMEAFGDYVASRSARLSKVINGS